MREIQAEEIIQAVKELCIQANKMLPQDVADSMLQSMRRESNPLAKDVLNDLIANSSAARELDVPICQDTGMAVVFIRLGQEVHICGDILENAVNEGVRQGYTEGLLRLSVVKDPLERENTNDNTPAIIHLNTCPGDKIYITVAPKGFGSENMSAIKMFTPAATQEDIIDFVLQTVKRAGSNPCPPMVVGVGIGGDFEYAAYLAKKALCRDLSQRNKKTLYRQMEEKLLTLINQSDIGPQGFGGNTTAIGVNIETFPTHIAGLPVAVNIGCHVNRHQSAVI